MSTKNVSSIVCTTGLLTLALLGGCGADALPEEPLNDRGDGGASMNSNGPPPTTLAGMPIDLDGDGVADGVIVDANGDGVVEGVDTNKDGIADKPLPVNGGSSGGNMGPTSEGMMGNTSGGGSGGTTAGSSTGGGSTCDQAANFLDVSKGSAGGSYAKPSLSVTCTDSVVTVKSNGIPNFAYNQVTPNALNALNLTYNFPRKPAQAANTTSVPLVGPIAVAVNGLPIFGPTEAPMDGSKDPYLEMILDYCNGHTAPGGMYHFHARPDCLFKDMEGKTHLVIAYAFDGYPILAPYICTDDACTATKEVQSGWKRKAGSATSGAAWSIHEYVGGGELDQCNGKTLSDGSYAYYATDTFPYFIGCYRGTPTANR